MEFESVARIIDGLKPACVVSGETVQVVGEVPPAVIDRLAWTAAFGASPEIKGTARWIIRGIGAHMGLVPASIHDLYVAVGRGDAKGFTVPAMNLRAMTYDTARAVFRAAINLKVGAFILEIARSEVGYTEQRPHEYSAILLAAALREGFIGPLFIQGDHVQVNAKKFAGPEREKELAALRDLIREEIAAGFFNIDIDTSTLVDLDQPTLAGQQHVNCEQAASFTRLVRGLEPKGVTISIGGEIGEVGGKNSDVHELRAFMAGYDKMRGSLAGISKISIQTGTAHGGFVAPDGSVRMDVKIDLNTLRELSELARKEFGMAGAVQHGASTLPPDAFHEFPDAGACEVHLATDFQNMVYEHPSLPASLKAEMYAWVREHAQEERKPKDTEEQFLYKSRKKAIGPFKRQLWSLPEGIRAAIGASLEQRFAFLMTQLRVNGTADVVKKFVKPAPVAFDRAAEVRAAGGTITASERKAEGLAD
ncbi:MAG: class II fructose-bisphosphate aldolase [Acidobacteria bacterium]|nr:class II fructose-bisphosphate aldolase [Acidobacteriota bacterium]